MYHLYDIWEGNTIVDISKVNSFFSGGYIRLWGGNTAKGKDVKFDEFKKILMDSNSNWGIYTCQTPWFTPQQNYDKIMSMLPRDSIGNLRILLDVEIVPPDNKKSTAQLANETYETYEKVKTGVGHTPWLYTGNWYWNPTLWYKQRKLVSGVYKEILMPPPWQNSVDLMLAQYYWVNTIKKDFTSYEQLQSWIPTTWARNLDGSNKEVLAWQWSGDCFSVPGISGKLDFIQIKDLETIKINPAAQPQVPPVVSETPVIIDTSKDLSIDIGYKSQLSQGAMKFKNDCGAASCGMIVDKVKKISTSIDELYLQAKPNGIDSGLSIYDMQLLLRKYDINSAIKWTHSIDDIISNIDTGNPVIAVIRYQYFRQFGYCEKGITFDGNHILLVKGYNKDQQVLIINDPLYYDMHGEGIRVPFNVFVKALSDPNCGMIVIPKIANIIPGGVVQPNPYISYKVTNSLRNVRTGAGTQYSIVLEQEKHYGDIVKIDRKVQAQGLEWGHIYGNNYWIYTGGFVEVK